MVKQGSIFRMACAAIAVIGALLVGPRTAHAGAGAFAVVGTATEKERQLCQGAATYAAGEAGWVMMKTALADAPLQKVRACLKAGDNPWSCLTSVAVKIGFDRLIVVQADKDSVNAATIVITVHVLAAQGAAVLVERVFCEACTATKLEEQIQNLATRQIRALMTQQGDTKIEVVSSPSSAIVKIDGAMVGETDATFRTYPGKHTVIVGRAGFANEVKEVTVAEGKTERIDLVLRNDNGKPEGGTGAGSTLSHDPGRNNGDRIDPRSAMVPTSAESPRSKLMPSLLIGGGAVALVVGGVLVFTHQSAPPLGQPQPERLDGNIPLGIGFGIAGAAAVGVGIYLWTRPGSSRSSGPVAMPLQHGGILGWAGTL